MTSGDFWVRKKFISLLWERFLIFYVHFRLSFCYVPFLYVFLAHSLDTQSSRYIVFLFLSGILKAFSSFIWKNFLFCCLIFWNINDDYTESKKVFYAWFSSSLCRCLLIFCLILSMCTSSHFCASRKFPPYVHWAKRHGAYTLLTQTQEKIWINDSWFTFCGFWINLHNGGWKINFIHIKCVYNSGFHSFEEKKRRLYESLLFGEKNNAELMKIIMNFFVAKIANHLIFDCNYNIY